MTSESALGGSETPARAYLPELMQGVPADYAAMDRREALEVLVKL